MKIFNGDLKKIALQSININYSYLDIQKISESLSEVLPTYYKYGLAASNDINTILIYLALLYNNCTFLIFDPSVLKNKNNFIKSIGLDNIISHIDLKELDQNNFKKEKINNNNIHFHLYKKELDSKKIRRNEPSILLNTSGSSGIPKIVRISYQNLISNTIGIIESLNLTCQDKSISTLPLFYTYGLSILNTHMFSGGTFYITDKSIIKKSFADELSSFKPTIFSGVPSTYHMLRKMDYFYIKQPFVRKITQAGGALDLGIQKEILEICSSKKSFYVMYGQTEATARISCFNLSNFPNKIGSVGLPLRNLSVEINDRDDNSKIGKIFVKGPSITSGYISTFDDLFLEPRTRTLDTGDLGYLDDDGFLFITGRSSRFCKINGKRYNLDVIEKEYNSVNLKKINAVSNDQFLFLFSIIPISKKTLKILGIHPTLIKNILIKNIPLKANGKVDYSYLLELAEKILTKK